jgi:probable FeS assembly SUF system protein SufT
MTTNEQITLARDCEAIQIPAGNKILLPKGTPVIITQTLGGTYTVQAPGGLLRIAGGDADALGLSGAMIQPAEPAAEAAPAEDNGEISEDALFERQVWGVLKSCYDPEIPVNIVDLGLIYSCELETGETGSRVNVKMTLTAPGCGMGPVIAREAEEKIAGLSGVASANVEVVWDPPWSPDRISAEGREKLGME